MQKHPIEELYSMLDEAINSENPGSVCLAAPPVHAHSTLNISVGDARTAFTFVIADEEGFMVSTGERIPWEGATVEDMKRSVEFAVDWLNDKMGEL